VRLKDGKVEHIDLDDLGPIMCSTCLSCTPFANYSVDISVGGIGSPEGYTTTLVRTKAAYRLLNPVISQGYLEEIESRDALQKLSRWQREKNRGEKMCAERKIKNFLN
jgi:coenzyme F420 hydrogenase subunit beta